MGAFHQGKANLEGKKVQAEKEEEAGKEKTCARCRGGVEIREARNPGLDE